MAVTKSLAQKLNARYGTPIPGESKAGVATSKTASPSIWDQARSAPKAAVESAVSAVKKTAPTIKKTIETAAKNMPAAEAQAKAQKKVSDLANKKAALKTLDFAAREALRKNAIPTKDGKFMLPSVDDPVLGMFEGLEFTTSEWAREFSAVAGNQSTISQGTGKEKKIEEEQNPWAGLAVDAIKGIDPFLGNVVGNAVGVTSPTDYKALLGKSEDEKQMEFWKQAESLRQSKARMEQRARAEEAAGFDYLAKLRASRATDDYAEWDTSITPQTVFEDIIKSGGNPLSLIGKQIDRVTGNNAARSGNEFNKAIQRTGIEAVGGLGSAAESFAGNDPYMNFISKYGAKIADDMKIKRLQTPELNQDKSVASSFMSGGYMDPAWYASTGGQVIPHALASMAAAITGGLIAGPAGAAGGAASYGIGLETGSMYDQMLEEGYSLNDAREASRWYGLIAGSLDAIVPGQIGGRMVNSTSKQMLAEAARETTKEGMLTVFKKAGYTTFKEATTEGAQQIAQNMTLQFYDKTQDIWEHVIDSFVGGAIGGTAFAAIDSRSGPDIKSTPTNPLTEEAQTGASEVAETMGITPADAGKMSKQEIDQSINTLIDASRAQEASVALGEQLAMKFPENAGIKKLTEEAKESLVGMNQQAQMLMEQHADTTAMEVLNQEGVKVSIGELPDGTFAASGNITVGDTDLIVPFSTDKAFKTKAEAVTEIVENMGAYVAKEVTTSGIQNTKEVENLVNILAGAKEAIQIRKESALEEDLTVYHGTTSGTKFSPKEYDYKKADSGVGSNYADQGNVFYTSSSQSAAKYFSLKANVNRLLRSSTKDGTDFDPSELNRYGEVIQYRLPKGSRVKFVEDMPRGLNAAKAEALLKSLKEDGFDAVSFPDKGFDTVQDVPSDLVDEIYNSESLPRTVIILNPDALVEVTETPPKEPTRKVDVQSEEGAKKTTAKAYKSFKRKDGKTTITIDGKMRTLDESTLMDKKITRLKDSQGNSLTVDGWTSDGSWDITDGGEGEIEWLKMLRREEKMPGKQQDIARKIFALENKIKADTTQTLQENFNRGPTQKQEETNKLVSRVSERMAEEYSEITPETYERIGIKDEIDKAIEAMVKDKEQTFRDAMGISDIPEYERAAKNIAMSEKALEEGNFELANQLIKSRSARATELGQAIVMEKASVTNNSPQKFMVELLATRISKLGENYTTSLAGVDLKKESAAVRGQTKIKDEVTKAKERISTKKKMDIKQAQDFIKSLQCK